jgi:hypothetical protein
MTVNAIKRNNDGKNVGKTRFDEKRFVLNLGGVLLTKYFEM